MIFYILRSLFKIQTAEPTNTYFSISVLVVHLHKIWWYTFVRLYIQQLYHIEAQAKEKKLNATDRKELRLTESLKIINALGK